MPRHLTTACTWRGAAIGLRGAGTTCRCPPYSSQRAASPQVMRGVRQHFVRILTVLRLGLLLAALQCATPALAQCDSSTLSDSVVTSASERAVLRLVAVWRDFMGLPSDSGVGSDLMLVLAFQNPMGGRVRIPGQIRSVWVAYEGPPIPLSIDSAWVSWDSIQVVTAARGGPRWPVGARIRVAVEWQTAAGAARCTTFPPASIHMTE